MAKVKAKLEKKANWRCNDCDDWTCETKQELVDHYRSEHSESPLGLWTAIEDIGDDFANALLKILQDRNREDARIRNIELTALRAKVDDYDKLSRDYAELCRRLQMIHLAIGGKPYQGEA